MQPMRQMKYEVEFLTPAFLGNAEQSGQWRTPPFKALLRQWWRVAVAEGFGYDCRKLREEEGRLFGHAWLESDRNRDGNAVHARASKVRIRLDRWDEGKETKVRWGDKEIRPPGWKIRHPEVRQPIGPLLYLGYGPLETRRVPSSGRSDFATVFKKNAAIQSGESANLSIAVPANHEDEMRAALALMNAYGAIGGRSRNGWGSFSLQPHDDASPAPDVDLAQFARPWRDALDVDWVHALGLDGQRPLIWQTARTDADWETDHAGLGDREDRTAYPVSSRQPSSSDTERSSLAVVSDHQASNEGMGKDQRAATQQPAIQGPTGQRESR